MCATWVIYKYFAEFQISDEPNYSFGAVTKQSIKLLQISLQHYQKHQLHDIIRPTYRKTDANLYSPERQLTKASEPSFDLEGGAQGQI